MNYNVAGTPFTNKVFYERMQQREAQLKAKGLLCMMHCPFCKTSAHSRSSRYLSDSVKHRYYQCQNVLCSATFRSMESVESIIRQPVMNRQMILSRLKWIKSRNSDHQRHNKRPGMNQ